MQFKPSKIRQAKYGLDKRLIHEKSFFIQEERQENLITSAPKKESIFKRLFGWMFGK
ncbi:MAG: hypothetical protein U9N49_02630 [Campylobacterota bacterium]|nr:hypothetical protein [Campylobacterota bacterium]